MLDTIRDAALEVERPIFFSLLIIVSAYIPLFTLERVERRLFTPMAFTVCYALLGSMLIALTLIPVLATYLFRNAPKAGRTRSSRWLYARYSARCSRHDRLIPGRARRRRRHRRGRVRHRPRCSAPSSFRSSTKA